MRREFVILKLSAKNFYFALRERDGICVGKFARKIFFAWN